MLKYFAGVMLFLLSSSSLFSQEKTVLKPESLKVKKEDSRWVISFTLNKPGDVEVAIIDKNETVVRHLAAGYIGKPKLIPEFQKGLSQKVLWDLTDDFQKAVESKNCKVRIRSGIVPKFKKLIGANPYRFGGISDMITDELGNVYVMGFYGSTNQNHMNLRVYTPTGEYIKELMPFPANLKKNAMKDLAEWDEAIKGFRPKNKMHLSPNFYGGSAYIFRIKPMTLISAHSKHGIYLMASGSLFHLSADGGVPEKQFKVQGLWPKGGGLPNPNKINRFTAVSRDGKKLYLSGPYSSKTRFGHVFNKKFAPGSVYQMNLNGKSYMKKFIEIPVAHKDGVGGNYVKSVTAIGHFTTSLSATHGVTVDFDNNILVADREKNRVVKFSPEGKELGAVSVKHPHLIQVDPTTKAIYVMTKDCVGYGRYSKRLIKFNSIKNGEKPLYFFDFPQRGPNPNFTVATNSKGTYLWCSGVGKRIRILQDNGSGFEDFKETKFKPLDFKNSQIDWARITVDYERDEIYASDGTKNIFRYDGKTGKGGRLEKDGKPYYMTELSVGYDGLLYARVSGAMRQGSPYNGSLCRLTRALDPAPYPKRKTHVISDFIYSRMGVGYAERGLGVGPKGNLYISFLYGWVKYAMIGFDKDGKPIDGKYLKDSIPKMNKTLKYNKYPDDLTSAVIGELPLANGGVKVDLKGNIYLGVLYKPKDLLTPKMYGKERAREWSFSVGSVVKFNPKNGGQMVKSMGPLKYSAKEFEGVTNVYSGMAPFSRSGYGGNTCCVCRTPRFDLDRYSRLALPNAIRNSVLIYDNAGNLLLEFGKYGNFDSQFIKDKSSEIKSNDIPLGWPTATGFSENALYINDTLNRRIVHTYFTYKESHVIK